jgi:predicted Rossmann fold nucleotide-binding protein DprA/Smf involved in DNA uptake
MLIGSGCDEVGSFPLLAGDDDDAGHSTRLSARLLREFGSGVFRASLTALEACNLPAPVAQAIFKKQNFGRAEKEVAALRAVGARLVNWTEPEFPQSLLQTYDPPVMLYARGDPQILNEPTMSIVGTRWRQRTARKWRSGWRESWQSAG